MPDGFNPARGIERYREAGRERYLTADELKRFGDAVREGETVGLPWRASAGGSKAKHRPKGERLTKLDPYGAAALRLLVLTGARLREVLHLKWDEVDLGRGLAFLAASKTGKKTLVLGPPALAVLAGLDRLCPYVIAGEPPALRPDDTPGDRKPRADLKRPWAAVQARAGLDGVRLHDLRHTYASFRAGGGFGLPVIGKLLGHAHAGTTQRYAHLADDPLRHAARRIARAVADAMGEGAVGRSVRRETVTTLRRAEGGASADWPPKCEDVTPAPAAATTRARPLPELTAGHTCHPMRMVRARVDPRSSGRSA